jgi:hypothetical protein
MNIRRILKERFRTSPMYELREWHVLSQHERELISGLHDEDDVYGVFSPTIPGSSLSVKVAYHEMALVYFHLTQSSKLPHYLTASQDNSFNQAMTRMVLDQVLEIEWNGKFVSGPHATEVIFGQSLYANERLPDFIAGLSRQGIEYVLHLDTTEIKTVANRLYTYNTIPWDSSLKINFSEHTDIRDFVFSASANSFISLLNKEWHLINDPETDYWLGWTRRHFANTSPTIYKLYISPVIHDLPQVINVVLPILTSSAAFSFKIGNSIQGLLRPDKMVLYFNDKSSLLQTGEELKDKLKDYRVQGVPFTAQIDDKGILSWGVDPPGSDILESIEGGSWRCKVTDQIALAVVQSKTEDLDQRQTIDFISSRLFVAGINPYDWTPSN